MRVFLQAVEVPKQCFLSEVLYWVAFQRLPVTSYDHEGVELHDSKELYENGELHPDLGGSYLIDDECSKAGIPNDPHFKALVEGDHFSEPKYYDTLLAIDHLNDSEREKLAQQRIEAVRFKAEADAWKIHYDRAIEYPASQIFVALRSGALSASGRLVAGKSFEKAAQKLERDETFICDVERTAISSEYWRLNGINFAESSACDNSVCYFQIVCMTDELLSLFPGERRVVSGVERVGNSFSLDESSPTPKATSPRGRPSYPWDQFNLEVMDLVRTNALPQKKEAAIQHFQDWFKRKHGFQPSRAAVGEKLKPIYDRFMKTDRK